MNRAELMDARRFAGKNPLAVAFLISLLIHLLLAGGWQLGQKLHWWDHQATWLMNMQKKHAAKVLARSQPNRPDEPPKPKEIPLRFFEVDPTMAQTEAPKDAKYYSSLNSKAANPDATVAADVPKIDGQQNKVERLADVPKPKPFPLQPTPPPDEAKTPTPSDQAESKPKPKPAEKPGDLALAKPGEPKPPSETKADATVGDSNNPPRERPRTLAQARAQNQTLAGQKMNQEGGVRERGKPSMDVKGTSLGSYDYKFIQAVQQRWYDLLESHNFPQRSGRVVLEFKLYFDGRIADMKMNGNEVGDMLGLLCERAVLDPAPFDRWPSDMRRAIPMDYREVTFTFFYN